MRCTFTNRTIGMTSFSIGTNRTIGTNGPSVWRIVSVCVYWTWVFGHTEPTATILVLLVLHHQILFGGKALKALESLQWVPYAQMPMSNVHNFPVRICPIIPKTIFVESAIYLLWHQFHVYRFLWVPLLVERFFQSSG